MSNVLTPKEWKYDNYPNIDWNDKRVSEYAVYYHSKMQEQGIKKDIILPEYRPVDFARLKFDPTEHENVTWNNCIDTTKELNGL